MSTPRIVLFSKVEDIKTEADGKFSGTLMNYNIEANGFFIKSGCYHKYHADEKKIPFMWNHEDGGSTMFGHVPCTPLGHMFVKDGKKGLEMRGQYNLNTEIGKEKYANLVSGDFNGFSAGAFIHDGEYNPDNGLFEISEMEAYEGSYTPFPADSNATASEFKVGGAMKINELNTEQSVKFTALVDEMKKSIQAGNVPAYMMDAFFSKKDVVGDTGTSNDMDSQLIQLAKVMKG
jgi:uncharacterized protein